MVLERELIQSRGFRNVQEGTDTVGFEIALRMPNYRGVWGSLIDGVAVTVDGQEWSREVPRWTLQGRSFSIQELRQRQIQVALVHPQLTHHRLLDGPRRLL